MTKQELIKEFEVRKNDIIQHDKTIFFFHKKTMEEVAEALTNPNNFEDEEEKQRGCVIDPENIGEIRHKENGFIFTSAYMYPEDSGRLSSLFPGTIVVGEGAWDINYYDVSKDGEDIDLFKSIKLDYREGEDDEDTSYFDLEITLFSDEGEMYTMFFGCISDNEVKAII